MAQVFEPPKWPVYLLPLETTGQGVTVETKGSPENLQTNYPNYLATPRSKVVYFLLEKYGEGDAQALPWGLVRTSSRRREYVYS